MTHKNNHQITNCFSHTYSYYAEPLVFVTNSADDLLMQIPKLLKHVLQATMYFTVYAPFLASLGRYILENSN